MAKKKVKGKSVKSKKKSAPKKKSAKKKTAKKAAPKKAGKKSAPKKVKKAVKKKAAKKIVKKVAKKTAKKAVKKKSAPKKTVTVKKPVAKVSRPAEVLDVKPAITNTPGNTAAETFKKHVTHLKAGDRAPFFEGVDQNGNRITSLDFPGKDLILFFYPQDDTETCTIEACNLRDEYAYLSDKNYQVIGISPDGVESHENFANKYSLPYPLIADTEMKIIKDYDVWGPKQLFGKIYDGLLRTTFVIGNEGIIRNVITEVKAADHAKQITGS